MKKLTKRMYAIRSSFDVTKKYDIINAIQFLKNNSSNKFIESIDVSVNLGIDVKKSDQNIRGSTVLPHGSGRKIYVAVFAKGMIAERAKIAGADLVGMEDLLDNIKKGICKFDVLIASPDVMPIVSQLGSILGPRGLMPNPKTGTVTLNIEEAVKNYKLGQIRYKNDKNGIIHTTIGKVNFENIQLKENFESFLKDIKKLKPIQTKGTYIKKITISSTMGIGIIIDQNSL